MTSLPPLLVLAKAPVLGAVKTRLAQVVGVSEALAVYQSLLRLTAGVAAQWPGPVVVYGSGDAEALSRSPLGAFPQRPQGSGGLGARLGRAFAESGVPAIAIGSDCPGLQIGHLTALAAALTQGAVALGPATDGGYWAIGIREPACVSLCCDDVLPWSTSRLRQVTSDRLQAMGHLVVLGASLADLDDAQDLTAAERAGFRWASAQAG